jgi:hypothetical protein
MARMNKRPRVKRSKALTIVRAPGLIPQVDFNPTFNQTFRFYCSATTNNLIISRGDLLNLLVMACSTGTAGTSGSRLMFATKVNWIHVYVPPVPPNSSSVVTISTLTWEGEYGKHKVVGSTALGAAMPSEYRTKPPRDTEAGFFSLSGSDEAQPLFNMDVVVNTLVDINLSFTLQNLVDNSSGQTIVTSTKTVAQGVIYCSALDGTSTNVFTPIGRNQW